MILKEIFNLIFKIILVLLVLVIIAAGVICSAELYRIKTAESITIGEITEHDPWEDFNIFNCDLSDAIFYKTATGYEYQETVPQAVEFNGTKNKYNVLLNNTPCINETSTAGILNAQNIINYYSIYGQVIQQTTLNIEIRFYQSEIEITISNTNNDVEQSYFMEYLRFKGLHLQIIDAQYSIQEPEIQTYTVTFLDYDNTTILNIATYKKGDLLVLPSNPTRDGYAFSGWSPAVPTYVTSNLTFVATYTELGQNGYILVPDVSGESNVCWAYDDDGILTNDWNNVLSFQFNGTFNCVINNGTAYKAELDNINFDVDFREGDTIMTKSYEVTFYNNNSSVKYYLVINAQRNHIGSNNEKLVMLNFLIGTSSGVIDSQLSFTEFEDTPSLIVEYI